MLGGSGMTGEAMGAGYDGRRRYIQPKESHMQDTGVSAPPVDRFGRGRRYIEEEDHQVLALGPMPVGGDDEVFEHSHGRHGRRAFPQEDHLKSTIMQPPEDASNNRALDPEEVKNQVREVLAQAHGVHVCDELRWKEVFVERNGRHWKIQAFTEQRRGLSRDGASARQLAEKLASAPTGELKHFGVRVGGTPAAVGGSPSHRVKGSPFEDNPTLVSPGVDGVLGTQPRLQGSAYDMSHVRKDPESMSRRYIASGKDNWESGQVASHGPRGDARDTAFCDGLERGIGHGRRKFDRNDHLLGPSLTSGR